MPAASLLEFPWFLYFLLAVNLVGVGSFFLFGQTKAKRCQRQAAWIESIIIEYFGRSGVNVSVGCISLQQGGRFVAFVESEPMKRFRLSHIIELTLKEHIAKICKLELEKIYWRFPIKEETKSENSLADETDTENYFNEGFEHYRFLPKIDVSELPWERYEEFANTIPGFHQKSDASLDRSALDAK